MYTMSRRVYCLLALAAVLLLGPVDCLHCAYDLDGVPCSVVSSGTEDERCPQLCLRGSPDASCLERGLWCAEGMYVPCSWSDGTAFSAAAAADGNYAVVVAGISPGVPLGGESKPGRLFAVGTDASCMRDEDFAIAQYDACSLLVRSLSAGGASDCLGAQHVLPDVMCAPRLERAGVGLGVKVTYDSVLGHTEVQMAGVSATGGRVSVGNSWLDGPDLARAWRGFSFAVCNSASGDRVTSIFCLSH